ncbi:MAG: ORF6N domain-containing protein [Planctomycetes bacterium]|nr:ORF6N domain-containing protein [Planctomycetota bacterium]
MMVASIEDRILHIRGQRVMLDADLAELYGTTTKALNQAVRRNAGRFPYDFVFRLVASEKNKVVTNCDHLRRLRFSPVLPLAFTEHGAIMAASVLNTPRAMDASVYVVRAFVKLRAMLASHREFSERLAELERKVGGHDEAIRVLVQSIQKLLAPPPGEVHEPIGFKPAKREPRMLRRAP